MPATERRSTQRPSAVGDGMRWCCSGRAGFHRLKGSSARAVVGTRQQLGRCWQWWPSRAQPPPILGDVGQLRHDAKLGNVVVGPNLRRSWAMLRPLAQRPRDLRSGLRAAPWRPFDRPPKKRHGADPPPWLAHHQRRYFGGNSEPTLLEVSQCRATSVRI